MTSPSRVDRATKWLEHVASAALIVMMLVTMADVLMRNIYNRPITGSVELVRIAMAYLVFMAFPQTFLRGHHVRIDVIDHLVGRRAVRRLDLLGELAALGLLAVTLWVMWHEAVDAHQMGDVTSDLMIPLSVLWAPMLLGTACSMVSVVLLIVTAFKPLPEPGR